VGRRVVWHVSKNVADESFYHFQDGRLISPELKCL
jgi:hypothetical protein